MKLERSERGSYFGSQEDALEYAKCVFSDLVDYHICQGSSLSSAINDAWMDIELACDKVCNSLKEGKK